MYEYISNCVHLKSLFSIVPHTYTHACSYASHCDFAFKTEASFLSLAQGFFTWKITTNHLFFSAPDVYVTGKMHSIFMWRFNFNKNTACFCTHDNPHTTFRQISNFQHPNWVSVCVCSDEIEKFPSICFTWFGANIWIANNQFHEWISGRFFHHCCISKPKT